MASSPIEICNAALLKIGAERISAFVENNKRARICNERYGALRKEVLRSHPWNFAIKRESLSQLGTTPEYQFDFKYQLPNDCLRVLETDDDRLNPSGDILGDSHTKYKIEGRLILTDSPGSVPAKCSLAGYSLQSTCEANGGTWTPAANGILRIRYIADITDTTLFDPSFDDALATRMAAEFAYPLVQSNSLAANMFNLYDLSLRRAKTRDGQEGSPDDLQSDFFLSSRF